MVSESWPPRSSSLLAVPRIVSLPSFLLIFSTPSILGQPSWLVWAWATPPAAVASAQAAIAAMALSRLEAILRACPVRCRATRGGAGGYAIGLARRRIAAHHGRRSLGHRSEAGAVAVERYRLALALAGQRRRRQARRAPQRRREPLASMADPDSQPVVAAQDDDPPVRAHVAGG